MRALLTFTCALALLPLACSAASLAETNMRTDIANGFTRYAKAWSAYQLQATTAQYDVGDLVFATSAPSQASELFSAYKLTPLGKEPRTFRTLAASETSIRVCVTATIKNNDQLNGFIQGVRDAKASLASATCELATLNRTIVFPTQISAIRTVDAVRARELIALDAAERAAQAAVADTVTFSLPAGKLLDFSTQAGQTSGWQTAYLYNNTGVPDTCDKGNGNGNGNGHGHGYGNACGQGRIQGENWSLSEPQVTGPYIASLSGCSLLNAGEGCALYVAFKPTTTGKQRGYVSVTTSTGKKLTIRVGGDTIR
jgi:hypothetical protein